MMGSMCDKILMLLIDANVRDADVSFSISRPIGVGLLPFLPLCSSFGCTQLWWLCNQSGRLSISASMHKATEI